jgi:maleamate amidohydrolase
MSDAMNHPAQDTAPAAANDELDIYRRQGMGQSVGFGKTPALVIVDFVVAFADPAHFGGGNIAAAIAQTARLLAHAREQGWPIAHTRVVYADDASDANPFTSKVPGLLKLTEQSPLSQIVPELQPMPGELIVRKRQASAFFGTELAGWLHWRGADTLVVSGCTTSGCVRATVIDSVAHNFRTILPVDATGDRAIGPHDANLFDMGQKYADLSSVDALIQR